MDDAAAAIVAVLAALNPDEMSPREALEALYALKLKAAKKALKKASCKPGKVSKRNGATAKTGKVKKQSPKPGKVLAPGAKVKLTLKP